MILKRRKENPRQAKEKKKKPATKAHNKVETLMFPSP
jgi:hypothetical protein